MWKPIETAPKGKRAFEDGPRFIAWGVMAGDYGYSDDTEGAFFARWHYQSKRFILDQPAPRYSGRVNFTHWMPLPERPADLPVEGAA